MPGNEDYSGGDKSLSIMVRVKRVAQTYFITWLAGSVKVKYAPVSFLMMLCSMTVVFR